MTHYYILEGIERKDLVKKQERFPGPWKDVEGMPKKEVLGPTSHPYPFRLKGKEKK